MSPVRKQLIVNHVPGDETRIALLEDGRLEEIYTEREAHDLHVGNIYLGKVVNVEAAIQAAFIDFGVGRNGFLHVSDLHPMYFPGEDAETTEAVGQKTPHRQRPPIQQCLKRGQEVLVQVLKEGIGTKGPTLTSYLSIPGRLLVMMPHMEQLGVSRKVEDIEQRREMRKILDSLELPEGFGFILRTAGLTALKTELKRDLAYLQRLWKTIESQRGSAKAPCELYVESDLLIRTIRDVSTADLEQIIIDDEHALARVNEFLQIVAPRRKGPQVLAYRDRVPIFHRFGVEEQLRSTHSREVPLPGGGSIIIDSAEAMVVIDVNSGRMRQFRDAETTAFRTNMQAIDEITRQLRLRDLGGLIVLDTIDMISASHRRELETRLRENLKRDRAKTEFLRISQFGLIEMTRQRMRPPLRKSHFMPCPTCEGRGQVATSESIANEAMRDMAYWIAHPRVASIEVALNQAVAAVLLSRKRRTIVALETETGKRIEIRVSNEIPADRVDFYAYDDHRTDLDLATLATTFPKEMEALAPSPPADESDGEDEEAVVEVEADAAEPTAAGDNAETPSRRKRRRRRGRRGRESDGPGVEPPAGNAADSTGQHEPVSEVGEVAGAPQDVPAEGGSQNRKKRRRRGRRGRGKGLGASAPGTPTMTGVGAASGDSSAQGQAVDADAAAAQAVPDVGGEPSGSPRAGKKRRRRRGRGKSQGDSTASINPAQTSELPEVGSGAPPAGRSASEDQPTPSTGRPRKKRRRRSSAKAAGPEAPAERPGSPAPGDSAAAPNPNGVQVRNQGAAEVSVPRPRRRLYGSYRRLSPAELASVQPADEG